MASRNGAVIERCHLKARDKKKKKQIPDSRGNRSSKNAGAQQGLDMQHKKIIGGDITAGSTGQFCSNKIGKLANPADQKIQQQYIHIYMHASPASQPVA
jgi:hypothetical protein